MKYKILTGGIVGVPITFLDKYIPDNKMGGYVMVGIANSARYIGNYECYTLINNRKIYNRILIRRTI